MNIDKVLEKFILNQTILGNTEKTILHYKKHIGFYILYLDEYNLNYDMNKFTYLLNYQNYFLYLKSKKCKNNNAKKLESRTIYTYCSALKTFFHFAFNEGYMKENIYEKIKLPRYNKKTIRILDENEIKDIFNYFDINTLTGSRNNLIMCLMLDSGLRLSEVTSLSLLDFSKERKTIKINGKGQKQRIVPLTETEIFLLDKYLAQFENKFPPIYPLFVNINLEPITNNAVKLFMRRLRNNLKIPDLHPHLLRHTFATLFLLNGGDPLHLQIILGHTTLNMTSKYVHLANQLSISKQNLYSPLSNIKTVVS